MQLFENIQKIHITHNIALYYIIILHITQVFHYHTIANLQDSCHLVLKEINQYFPNDLF